MKFLEKLDFLRCLKAQSTQPSSVIRDFGATKKYFSGIVFQQRCTLLCSSSFLCKSVTQPLSSKDRTLSCYRMNLPQGKSPIVTTLKTAALTSEESLTADKSPGPPSLCFLRPGCVGVQRSSWPASLG